MKSMTRRRFLQYGAGAGVALALPWAGRVRPAGAAVGGKLTKYMEPLPLPGAGIVVATPSSSNLYSFTQRQISKQLHPQLPPTPLWAYDDGSGLAGQAGSFGMAVVAETGTPLDISFTNNLPTNYPSWIPVDTQLTPLGNEVRVMTHLHGGFVAEESDGNPAVTPNGFGPGDIQTVHYTNQAPQMPASLLWFHDHGLGATRLNVFAGLAAGYILRDEFDTGAEPNPIGIPGATWIGEYFGDVMLVNGKVWPFLDVEPRMYRFRILNGCNARVLNLGLGGVQMWQIGAEGGLWDQPVAVKNLVLAPAERADVLVDFRRSPGQTLVLKNAAAPKPVSNPAPSLTAVMQLRVGTTVSSPGPTTIPASLPGQAADLHDPVTTRYISLNEIDPEEVTWYLNLNGLHFDEGPVTEAPKVGTVEDWVYVNVTGDTHPMHTHLVTFQVIGRTPFDAEAYEAAHGTDTGVPGGIDPTPFATGPMQPPDPSERGFKDTVKANPGQFTTIRAKFDLPAGVTAPQRYVYHCHIVEHEDNDMMRPYTVRP